MRNLFALIFLFGFTTACKKDAPVPIPSSGNPATDSAAHYGGTYNGMVTLDVSGVDSTGVYKYDTSYAYSVIVIDAGENKITIHGETEIEAVEVNDTGYFEFNDYNRNIEGDFRNDSLYLFSGAISGSYEPPQFYSNTKMSFAGLKQ
ncbi:MAG: hypothetical protein H0V65_07575 [Chitinophagales bacterium]|jgi:hypothetical protein|nr:hypothetical protein [Chitinophagales bacterium]